MSIERTVELTCPRCGSRGSTNVWDSLNVGLDPAAKAALLAGKLNVFHCSTCGQDARLDMALLYHDMERETLVQFYPFQRTERDDFFGGFTAGGRPDFTKAGFGNAPAYFSNIHVVFSMDELVRYVIFRDRLYEHNVRTAPSAEQGPGGIS